MKLTIPIPTDGQAHQYCPAYYHETIEQRWEGDQKYYYCLTCQHSYERRIKLDPTISWWVTEDKEICHESVGIFVRNHTNRFLFYTRKIYPPIRTVPSGHVDAGEDADKAAKRELWEEVELQGELVKLLTTEIEGDPCSMGSDRHRWHVYLLTVNPTSPIKVTEHEGKDPVWLTLEDALREDALALLENASEEDRKKQLVAPVRYLIQRCSKLLTS